MLIPHSEVQFNKNVWNNALYTLNYGITDNSGSQLWE